MDEYVITTSGFWTKLSDGSGPYVRDGNTFTLLSGGGGGGATVDVMSEFLTGYEVKPGEPLVSTDEVVVAFGKLQGQINVLITNLKTAESKITTLEGTVSTLTVDLQTVNDRITVLETNNGAE